MASRMTVAVLLILILPAFVLAEETFVSIHKVIGNRMSISKSATGFGRGRRGGSATATPTDQAGGRFGGRGRGRFAGRGASSSQQIIVTVPASAKITSGMRERRTFEFRAGAELSGGLRNRIFKDVKEPLSARIVTKGNVITEVNVITDQTDINQSNIDSSGRKVIAIRPKRPPMKRK